jgi:hypothetical protein
MFRVAPHDSDRRSFLGAVAAVAGVALLDPLSAPAAATARTGTWDLSWVNDLKGKHRQVFDIGTIEDPLRVIGHYFDAHEEVFGLRFPEVNAVIGIAFSAFPINVSDALWAKYGLGERWEVKDPETSAWAVRNVFRSGGATPREQKAKVEALQARGALLWQCNHALDRAAEALATATHASLDSVRAELVAGLLPGVRLVPAHTLLLNLVQERVARTSGCERRPRGPRGASHLFRARASLAGPLRHGSGASSPFVHST